jgi:ABC-type transport system substrate-binding protein
MHRRVRSWHRVLGLTVTLCLAAGSGTALGQASPAPRGELRIVDPSPLNWVSVTLNVFEHLWEPDPDGKVVPRLATGWRWLDDRTLEVKLRAGVKFQDGEAFDAEIVKLNWEENTRVRQPHLPGDYLSFKPGSRIEIVDRSTVRFVFSEPDGAALVKLGAMHIGNRRFYRELGWKPHW